MGLLQPRYASSENQELGHTTDTITSDHSVEVLEGQSLFPEYGFDNPRRSKRHARPQKDFVAEVHHKILWGGVVDL